VLVLDEPTNDLDLNTLRLLEEAITGFKGSVLVVSHDRYFLNRVCDGILAFEGEGDVRYHVGNYDYYLEKKPKLIKQTPSPASTKLASKSTEKTAPVRKLKWAEERELESMEETILEHETKLEELTEQFNAPDFYEKHKDNWESMQKNLDDNKKKVQELYDRWEMLEQMKQNYLASIS